MTDIRRTLALTGLTNEARKVLADFLSPFLDEDRKLYTKYNVQQMDRTIERLWEVLEKAYQRRELQELSELVNI